MNPRFIGLFCDDNLKMAQSLQIRSYYFLSDIHEHDTIPLRKALMIEWDSLPKVSTNYWYKKREVVQIDTYEVISLLFLGGSFLVALLAYIDRNYKRK